MILFPEEPLNSRDKTDIPRKDDHEFLAHQYRTGRNGEVEELFPHAFLAFFPVRSGLLVPFS